MPPITPKKIEAPPISTNQAVAQTDRDNLIKRLELIAAGFEGDAKWAGDPRNMEDAETIREAITLLKANETSLEKVASDYGLTVDGVEFALQQYQTVICEITHSRMSKLSYYARDILSLANDLLCDGCELKDVQAPIKASIKDSDGGTTHWYVCGSCKAHIQPGDNYCHECGKPVNWDD